jgi:hypothetical protein
MKLKSYKELFEKYDSPEDEDDLFGRPSHSKNNIDSEDDDDLDTTSEDMENLLYLLRTLFKSSGVDIEIENKGLDIIIYSVLNKRQKMSSILKIFNVVKKLKTDILPQYDSEFELWETKTGDPMFTFNFMYEGRDGDTNHDGNLPFSSNHEDENEEF